MGPDQSKKRSSLSGEHALTGIMTPLMLVNRIETTHPGPAYTDYAGHACSRVVLRETAGTVRPAGKELASQLKDYD